MVSSRVSALIVTSMVIVMRVIGKMTCLMGQARRFIKTDPDFKASGI